MKRMEVFSAQDGQSQQHLINQEVVEISPGLPTPPSSPYHRRPDQVGLQHKITEDKEGGGDFQNSVGSYNVLTQKSLVDDLSAPIASRPSVHRPKDWYRSMFRQIHKRPEDPELDWQTTKPSSSPPNGSEQHNQVTDNRSFSDWAGHSETRKTSQLNGILDLEREEVEVVERANQTPVKPESLSLEDTLVSELNRFQAELDLDICGLEKTLSQKRRGRGEENFHNTRREVKKQDRSSPTVSISPSNQRTTTSVMAVNDSISPEINVSSKKDRKMTAARAKFNFQAQSAKELTLQKGEIVYIHRQVDANWSEGEHHGRVGIFPNSYVEIVPPSEKPNPVKSPTTTLLEYGEAKALFNFTAELPVELAFKKGEVISIIRRVDSHWLEGRISGTARKGIFPENYVQVNKMPRTKSTDDYSSFASISPEPEVSPTSPSSQTSPGKTCSSHSNHFCFSPSSSSALSMWSRSSHPQSATDRSSPSSTNPTMSSPNTTQNGTKPKSSSSGQSQSVVSSIGPKQHYKAVYSYKPQNKDELELNEGDIVQVVEQCDDGWFVGASERTQCFGTFPGNYVAPV